MSKDLKFFVSKAILRVDATIAECKEKLESSFMYNFEWGYAGDLYLAMAEKKELDNLMAFISANENVEDHIGYLKYQVKGMTKDVLSGRFTGGSTSQFSNIAHTMRKEINCKLIELYEEYIYLVSNND